MPKPDAQGNFPAVEFARASLARKIIKARRQAGLTQAELARRAGIRPETLNRIEKGKTTPGIATVAKIQEVVDRLNRLNGSKGCLYFWRKTKLRSRDLHRVRDLGISSGGPRINLYAVMSLL